MMKKRTHIVDYGRLLFVKLELDRDEFSVLKSALQSYNNSYGNRLLKRIKNAE
jgi:hypothetical protein